MFCDILVESHHTPWLDLITRSCLSKYTVSSTALPWMWGTECLAWIHSLIYLNPAPAFVIMYVLSYPTISCYSDVSIYEQYTRRCYNGICHTLPLETNDWQTAVCQTVSITQGPFIQQLNRKASKDVVRYCLPQQTECMTTYAMVQSDHLSCGRCRGNRQLGTSLIQNPDVRNWHQMAKRLYYFPLILS